MTKTFTNTKEATSEIGFLKLFTKLKDEFGLIKALFSTWKANNFSLADIVTINTITEDTIRKYRNSKYFLIAFIGIDAALAIPFAAFILTNIFMIPKGSSIVPIASLISAPIFSSLLIRAGYSILKNYMSLNKERTSYRKVFFPVIGAYALLLFIPIGTLLVWLSANHTAWWRVFFDVLAPVITALGVCSAVYVSAMFHNKHQNLEETIKKYKEAKNLEDHNEEIIGRARSLKSEIETVASKFLPYVQEDSTSQIIKRFATLPLDEKFILIKKIYGWQHDQLFNTIEKDVMIEHYFGEDIENNDFIKFWQGL